MRGEPFKVVQELLGHANIEATNLNESRLKQAVAKLDEPAPMPPGARKSTGVSRASKTVPQCCTSGARSTRKSLPSSKEHEEASGAGRGAAGVC